MRCCCLAASPRLPEAIIFIINIIVIVLIALSTLGIFHSVCYLLSIWYAFVRYLVASLRFTKTLAFILMTQSGDAARSYFCHLLVRLELQTGF
jgi:hypothetical protein